MYSEDRELPYESINSGDTHPDSHREDTIEGGGRMQERFDSVEADAGKSAKEIVREKLLRLERDCKFIVIVNNMTGSNLKRTDASGDSFPFSFVKKGKCVAAFFQHRFEMSFSAVFTAEDENPGTRTVMIQGSWFLVFGRHIGVYSGGDVCPWYRLHLTLSKVSDHNPDDNSASICQRMSYNCYEYDLKELKITQFAVRARENVVNNAIDQFAEYSNGKLPDFSFVVNNLTGHNLYFKDQKKSWNDWSWPLQNIKRGDCAVAGFDSRSVSFVAHYTAHVPVEGDQRQQKSISMAAIWPLIGHRKIFVCRNKDAIHTMDEIKFKRQDRHEEDGNTARIEERENGKKCVYIYELRNL